MFSGMRSVSCFGSDFGTEGFQKGGNLGVANMAEVSQIVVIVDVGPFFT